MPNVHNNLSELFTGIADAIRSKTGSGDPIVADEFPAAIEAIAAGGGSTEEWINDGNTHIWISLEETRTSPKLRFCVNGTVTVDWGDGSEPDTLTGTSVTSTKNTSTHEYGKIGEYVITLSGGEIGFKGASNMTDLSSPLYYAKHTVTKIELGDNVSNIGDSAFASCNWLKSVKIPNHITNFGGRAFANCSSLQSINIPDGVTSFPTWLLANCYSLPSINIPDGVTSIGESALRVGYSLRGVITIPASVMSIDTYAFMSCSGVMVYDFTKHTSVPTLVSNTAFTNISGGCEIRVPAALVDEWKAATNWATYAANIVGV